MRKKNHSIFPVNRLYYGFLTFNYEIHDLDHPWDRPEFTKFDSQAPAT